MKVKSGFPKTVLSFFRYLCPRVKSILVKTISIFEPAALIACIFFAFALLSIYPFGKNTKKHLKFAFSFDNSQDGSCNLEKCKILPTFTQ